MTDVPPSTPTRPRCQALGTLMPVPCPHPATGAFILGPASNPQGVALLCGEHGNHAYDLAIEELPFDPAELDERFRKMLATCYIELDRQLAHRVIRDLVCRSSFQQASHRLLASLGHDTLTNPGGAGAFVAFRSCGCVMGTVVEAGNTAATVADQLTAWVLEGYRIERASPQVARMYTSDGCPHRV